MNSFGRMFRISIFGESHGIQIGVVIDGCPAGIPLAEDDLKKDFARRRAGGRGTTPRVEPDIPSIVSGVFQGKTTGAPLTIVFENTNIKSDDYSNLWDQPRPGHADFTAQQKYGGHNDPRGGGHFSGRITLGIVAAGVVAKKILGSVTVAATLIEAGGRKDIAAAVEEAIEAKDSIGGLIECRCTNMPVGLMGTLNTISLPLVMPPFIPLAKLVEVFPCSSVIQSLCSLPVMEADANPEPNSMPRVAGTAKIIWAIKASAESKNGSPIPTGILASIS